jgi:hypothetical protein
MANISEIKVDGTRLAKNLEIGIVLTHTKELGARLWIANKLLRLARLFSPFEINVTSKTIN